MPSPWRRRSRSSARSRSAEAASSAVNGSSSRSSRGAWSSARAMAARCSRPAAQPRGRVRRSGRETGGLQRRARGGGRLGHAVQPRGEGQVLRQGEVVVQERMVGEEPDGPAGVGGVPGERAAEHPDVAGGGPHQPGQHAEQGALARAVRARHGEDLARRQRQIDVAKYPKTAEGATQAAGRQQRLPVTGRRRSAHRARRGGMA